MPSKQSDIINILAPSPGESITEVELAEWLVADGDFVKKNQLLLEIESEKASLQLVAEKSGKIKLFKQSGETVSPGTKIASISVSENNEKEKSPPPTDKAKSADKNDLAPNKHEKSTNQPSIAAKKIIAENKLSTQDISASGKDGRITKGDALNAINSQSSTSTANKKAATPVLGAREETEDTMSQLRKKISARLVAVKNETAMLTTFNEVDLAKIIQIRKEYKEPFKEKYQVGLGFMSFFAKACTVALMEFPMVNSRLNGDKVITSHYVDLGIAVSAPKGLMVPVIRSAESLSLSEIESNIVVLAKKARAGQITIDDMTGGTFTITNGGVFGSMLSTPILNPPQSAILGMHNIVERPVVINGEIVIRPIMYLALSYDHRILDGKYSVTFLSRIKALLEDPIRLLLKI
ncbi:MAG: 2-oxoglutarate dehydrogenase complex dihydrolipoyllysine-residue succinyltransferase [SAR324 cluster bacterium]|nr:2-oxoglutarate dehydrogenase complex dihydrolipoyllysine-residue succinyltransferase [SAR324 cluster bacterium]